MDGGKCTTSAEGQTIRIAESSEMDDWKAVLDHVQNVVNNWLSLRMITTIPKGRYGGGNW